MKVLIVEDETAAYNSLKKILSEVDSDIEVVGITESIEQTVRFLLKEPPIDLIFMDIHLSDGSAFTIFSAVHIETPVIFTTAYDEYAINAFKVNSIDYLLKPIEEEAIIQALSKFRKLNHLEALQYISRIPQLISSNKYPEKLLVSHKDKLIPVSLNDIACFYTSNEQTRLILKNGKKYAYNKPLDNIIQTLNPQLFFRANKQFIIAKNSINDITIWFDSRLLIKLNVEAPEKIFISKNKAADFKKWVVD